MFSVTSKAPKFTETFTSELGSKSKSKSKYRYVGKIVWDITPTRVWIRDIFIEFTELFFSG